MPTFGAWAREVLEHSYRDVDFISSHAFDEWNIWYAERYEKEERIADIETWTIAPRLLEDV